MRFSFRTLIPHPLKTKSSSRTPSAIPKILTVDDARAVRLLVQKALAGFVCEVSDATNGFNALFSMERSLPDLILLDVSMPIMGGVQMLTMLKSKPELQAIPVIILASPADHLVRPQIEALGVRGTVMKPFTEAALVEKILSVLELKPLGK